jgi:Immunity protein 52
MPFYVKANFPCPSTESLAFRYHAERLKPIMQQLKKTDPFAKEWLLKGDTEKEAYLYLVFEEDGSLTKAAEAVLETAHKKQSSLGFGLWNGEMDKSRAEQSGASISYLYGHYSLPSDISIEYPPSAKGIARLGNQKDVETLITLMAQIFSPYYAHAIHGKYEFNREGTNMQVFEDRPGVGWMLYLPQVLTAKQVPEARALIPVMHKDDKKKQQGTIIVSVTDEAFDPNNKEHVKVANSIEIRLVDQDLLPRYADFVQK